MAGGVGASWGRASAWRRLKPGWYALFLLGAYALFATTMWFLAARNTRVVKTEVQKTQAVAKIADNTLRWPIIGAVAPEGDENLPNAARNYRRGVAHGFVFTDRNSGVPIVYGQPVVAAGNGLVIRADLDYTELNARNFAKLLRDVRGGATESDMNHLRGRQVLIRHANGNVTRYAHLSRIHPGLRLSGPVQRGQIIGYVGNSGTLEAARGTQENARLLFELWQGNHFFGWNMKAGEIRTQARTAIQTWP